MGPLPQHFADRFGWPEMAAEVARVAATLPEAERKTARVWARNYGEAAALEKYGAPLGVPPVLCPHNSFWFWSVADAEKNAPFKGPLVVIGGRTRDARRASSGASRRPGRPATRSRCPTRTAGRSGSAATRRRTSGRSSSATGCSSDPERREEERRAVLSRDAVVGVRGEVAEDGEDGLDVGLGERGRDLLGRPELALLRPQVREDPAPAARGRRWRPSCPPRRPAGGTR